MTFCYSFVVATKGVLYWNCAQMRLKGYQPIVTVGGRKQHTFYLSVKNLVWYCTEEDRCHCSRRMRVYDWSHFFVGVWYGISCSARCNNTTIIWRLRHCFSRPFVRLYNELIPVRVKFLNLHRFIEKYNQRWWETKYELRRTRNIPRGTQWSTSFEVNYSNPRKSKRSIFPTKGKKVDVIIYIVAPG